GNAVSESPSSVPGHVSFEVIWAGSGERTKVRDADFDFGGEFVTGPATVSFTASDDGSSTVYTADAAGQRSPAGVNPGVGHERTGVFFDCLSGSGTTTTSCRGRATGSRRCGRGARPRRLR